MRQAFSFLVLVVALGLVACRAPEPFASSILPTPEATPTPLVSLTANPEPTPEVATSSQPSATWPATLGPPFKLNPLTSESKEATGQGPVGFTLVIVDATSGARILGSGQPDEDGNFRIPLSQPPVSGHLVGLTVDLPREQLESEEFMRRLFEIRGPGFRLIPQVVTVYDSYPVP